MEQELHLSCDKCGYSLSTDLLAVKVKSGKENDAFLLLRCPVCHHQGKISMRTLILSALEVKSEKASS